jgi:clan AA aspartic protease
MGKVIEKVKLWNFLDEEKIKEGRLKPVEVEAQVDNGATTVVLPKDLADKLNLPVVRRTKVRYADERIGEREVVRGLVVEIQERSTICEAVVEPKRKTALIGQFVLEVLDLWIDAKRNRLIPNPESPDIPLIDEL